MHTTYSQVSGHHSRRAEQYEMSQRDNENPNIVRQIQSDASSYYKQGDQPPVQMSQSSYEQSTTGDSVAGKGVLSLSKAFESKSLQNPSYTSDSRGQAANSRQFMSKQNIDVQGRQRFGSFEGSGGGAYIDESQSSRQVDHQIGRPNMHVISNVNQRPQETSASFTFNKPTPTNIMSEQSSQQSTEVRNYSQRQAYTEDQQRKSTYIHQDQHQIRQPVQFHVPGSNVYDMTAFVQSPSGRTEQCQVVDLDDNNYSIRFIPRESGTHSVNVRHKGEDIPGSPFEFYVGPVAGKGARSIQVYGNGLVGGYVNERCQFEIYTKEAGAGSLSVAVEGPVKSEIDFSDKKDGTCIVAYQCPEFGEYKISVKFNDQHVPGSPFIANIKSPFGSDVPQMRLIDNLSGSHNMNEQMSFTVDMTGRKGRLEAYIVSPNGIEQPCTLLEGANNSYTIRFTPDQGGIHWVHVKYNGREIPDSPFRVPVNENTCDPSKVFASGAGLYHGEVYSPCEFFIDTSAAGTGALSVTVDGPSKVDIDCIEIEKGYRASYTPTMQGLYIIIIKFAEIQIAGSPFHCHVYDNASTYGSSYGSSAYGSISRPLHTQIRSEQPLRPVNVSVSEVGGGVIVNSDKVSAYGTGLSHAFTGEDAHFTVDTNGAGRSVLTISMQGPRKPSRDIEVRKCGENLYDVCYNLPQSGIYHLTVKWADRHIMGSPFTVNVA
ncbi:hypothetical protein GJ496_004387 [Pomphorhynchus laevis]|nr:hypothetical protein GJ496_004387 [Pomphorhynchus laevis]